MRPISLGSIAGDECCPVCGCRRGITFSSVEIRLYVVYNLMGVLSPRRLVILVVPIYQLPVRDHGSYLGLI